MFNLLNSQLDHYFDASEFLKCITIIIALIGIIFFEYKGIEELKCKLRKEDLEHRCKEMLDHRFWF